MSAIRRALSTLDELLERGLRGAWRHRTALGAALVLGVAAWGVSRPAQEAEDLALEAGAPVETMARDLADHAWIDRFPKDPRDKFRIYFFASQDPIGVHLTFHGQVYWVQEVFRYGAGDGRIGFEFFDPQVKMKTKVQIKKVKDREHVDRVMHLAADPHAKGARYRYLRLKKDHQVAGVPSLERIRALASAALAP